MVSGIVTALTGLICTALSSVVTFFLTRRKYNTEVDSQQIENMNKSFDLYKKMMEESLESQRKTMEATISSQNDKIVALQKDYDILRNQYTMLQQQLLSLLLGGNSEAKNKLLSLVETLKTE